VLNPDGRLLLEIGYGIKDSVVAIAWNFHKIEIIKDL
jgi:hypothetical protein